jgi:heme/copper-type cytochrome/quinol oxidase subunit 2
MIGKARTVALSVVPLAIAGQFLAVPRTAPARGGEAVTVVIEAGAFAFSPARLAVAEGDSVTLVLRSTDYVHGLHLEGYDVELTADPGRPASRTFVADRPGVFRFRCSVPCGPLHPFMAGRLRVGPGPLLYALLLALAAAFAGGFFGWTRRSKPSADPP